jgi:dipeptidyl aminopeptidase/acylaminoacyl peptidase
MQDDVTDATQWAIGQGLADPKRIAIAGASYGGYATLMGLLREPGLYRCGVCWVGVTDLDMLHTVSWDDLGASYKKHGMPKLLGDREKDAADLKANSPLTHAAKITQPLLLAYGGKDQRVPIVHGEKFKRAVQATNPKVDWVVYGDEGHGWVDPDSKLDFYNRMATFLDKNTGPV